MPRQAKLLPQLKLLCLLGFRPCLQATSCYTVVQTMHGLNNMLDDNKFVAHGKPMCAAVLQRAVPCCALLYCMPCCAVLCCDMLCCALLSHALLCHAMLCHAMLCHAVLCCAINYCAMLNMDDDGTGKPRRRRGRRQDRRLWLEMPLEGQLLSAPSR